MTPLTGTPVRVPTARPEMEGYLPREGEEVWCDGSGAEGRRHHTTQPIESLPRLTLTAESLPTFISLDLDTLDVEERTVSPNLRTLWYWVSVPYVQLGPPKGAVR